MTHSWFSGDLPVLEWAQFAAAGFPEPVTGVVFTSETLPCCGLPLGGISTGCIDIDSRGVWGFSTLFNPSGQHPVHEKWRIARKLPQIRPFLGIAVEGKSWVLATKEMLSGDTIPWCTEPQMLEVRGQKLEQIILLAPKLEGVEAATAIRYWGHFPIVDLAYETAAPLSVWLRAWSPFIPGDAPASNIPAAMFEVHLHNHTDRPQRGTVAFSFPGPDPDEARAVEFTRRPLDEAFKGVHVNARSGVGYVLGVIDGEDVRFGGDLGCAPSAWSAIAHALPQPSSRVQGGDPLYQDAGSSAAVDFVLAAGEERVVRFLLAWYAPVWEGARNREMTEHKHWLASPWAGDTNYYTQMYAARYDNALDVARRMASDHAALLDRVLAWQRLIYAEEKLPVWLRDSLVNNLYLIAETGHWAQAKPPLGDWCHPAGLFALDESPRGCPHMACIPCDWYGNLPIVYFFPELACSTLKAFKMYQTEEGEIPFALGKIGDLPDLATPEYFWQVSLNGMCYVDMVDRLWQRTGDNSLLAEFYLSVKRCTTFTMNLCKGPGGVISMPDIGGMEWFEFGEWAGMASHMGGLRLAQLRMVERMAATMGDTEYAEQCRRWFVDGSRAMEEEMWAGSYYLNFYEKKSGKKSDDIMGYQLDGEWAARFHGLPGVFQPDRVQSTLKTIRRCNVALTPEIGAANFARPDGAPLAGDSQVAAYGQYAMFPPELLLLAMTYLYAGNQDFGLDLAHRHWANLVLRQRHPWDLPNIVRGDNGQRVFGTDYYQNMMLWALPAALAGQDIAAFCAAGGLADRVIRAGQAIDLVEGVMA